MLSASLTFFAATIVLAYALAKLNGMHGRSCNVSRVAHILIAVGAFGEIIHVALHGPVVGRWAETCLIVGVAIMVIDLPAGGQPQISGNRVVSKE